MDDRLDELMGEIYDMPEGTARISALEDAIRLADQLGRVDDAFELRLEFIRDCTFFGQQLKALSAFSWCLGKVDMDSERFPVSSVLWEYKWICAACADFYEIPFEKCNSLIDDYKTRLGSEGYGLYSYWYLLMNHAIGIHDKAQAEAAFREFHAMKPDAMADCAACVQDGVVYYMLYAATYEEALEAAKPILQRRMSCAEVPHLTYSNLLMPALEAGDKENAAKFAEAGYRRVSKNPDFLKAIGSYLRYYACVDIDRAVKIYAKHLKWVLNPYSLSIARMYFSQGAAIMFNRLSKHNDSFKLNLPKEFALYSPAGAYNAHEFAEYHKDVASELIKLFDERNGNTGYADEYARNAVFVENYK